MSERPRDETMWYCPDCQSWNGTQLDSCLRDGRPRPRRPVRSADVPYDDARRVTLLDRLRAKLRR